MKKLLTVTCLAGLLSIPSVVLAEASWYGSIRTGVSSSGGEASSFDGFSRWGIRGSSEVSEGLTAVYRYERKIDSKTATDSGGRLSYVGLSAGFGTITVGQIWSASFNTVGAITDNSNVYGDSLTSYRIGNTVSYAMSSGNMNMQIDAVLDGSKAGNNIDQFEFGVSMNVADLGKIAFAHKRVEDHTYSTMVSPGTYTSVSTRQSPEYTSTSTVAGGTVTNTLAVSPVVVTNDLAVSPVVVTNTLAVSPVVVTNDLAVSSVEVANDLAVSAVEVTNDLSVSAVEVTNDLSVSAVEVTNDLAVSAVTIGGHVPLTVTGSIPDIDNVNKAIVTATKAAVTCLTLVNNKASYTTVDPDKCTGIGTTIIGPSTQPDSTKPALLKDVPLISTIDDPQIDTSSAVGSSATYTDGNGVEHAVMVGTRFVDLGKTTLCSATPVDATCQQEAYYYIADATATNGEKDVTKDLKGKGSTVQSSTGTVNLDSSNLTASGGELSGTVSASGGELTGTVSASGGELSGTVTSSGGELSGTVTSSGGELSGTVTSSGGELSGTVTSSGGELSGTVTSSGGELSGDVTASPVEVTTTTTGTDPGISTTTTKDPEVAQLKTDWGSTSNFIAGQMTIGGITGFLGYTEVKSNETGDSMGTTHAGVNGSIGDTGLTYLAQLRNNDAGTPWLFGVSKSLGGGASVNFEYSDSDVAGAKSSSAVWLKVDF